MSGNTQPGGSSGPPNGSSSMSRNPTPASAGGSPPGLPSGPSPSPHSGSSTHTSRDKNTEDSVKYRAPSSPANHGATTQYNQQGKPGQTSSRVPSGAMLKHPYRDGNQSYNNNLSQGAGNQHVSEPAAPGDRLGAKSKTGQDYLVNVNIVTCTLTEKKSFTADFLKMRKWAHISESKKILEMVCNPCPSGTAKHYGGNELGIEICLPTEMAKPQLSSWGSNFLEAVEKLDFLQIELQGSEEAVQRLLEELNRMGKSIETIDYLVLSTQSLVIQGPLADFISLLSKAQHIGSLDMIDPYTKAKLNYCAVDMPYEKWKWIEYLDSFENAQRKFQSVHLFKENETLWGIGEEKVVEEVHKYFSKGLFLEGVKSIPKKTLKDFPEQVLKFMEGKCIQECIDEKVKKHGIWKIREVDGKRVLNIHSKFNDNLIVIEGLVRRYILWKIYPIRKNAVDITGNRLQQLRDKIQKTNPKQVEKISAELASTLDPEGLSVILIYTCDIIEDPQLKGFLEDLRGHVQYEEKSLKLPFHSYLEEVCKKDITEVAGNHRVELCFSKESGEIHLKGSIAEVAFVENYLKTFSNYHLIIPVPDCEAMKQKVDDLKRRSPIFVQMSQEKKAKMWITQNRSVILYCGQLDIEAFDRQVSVIPEMTENKELFIKKGNIQWEEVNHSFVHIRLPKWQSGDHKDKHLMRDTLEEMTKQLISHHKISVLFPMHGFPSWPVERLAKSIIFSTAELNGHLKVILIHPHLEKYESIVETISVYLKDAATTDVCIFDIWGEESVLEACSMELERTFSEEMQKSPTSGKVKQVVLREPADQTMSFRNTTNEDEKSPSSSVHTRQEKEEKNEEKEEKNGYLAENEESKACIVIKFANKEAVEKNISDLTKEVKPRTVISPYEKENMALVVFENAMDAAKVMENHKKFLEKEMTLEFLPKQAVVGVHAQISSAFLEKFQNKSELRKGIQSSSGVQVKEIAGKKWVLSGSLPQIQLAHRYLQNEFTKMKSAGHLLQLSKQETKKIPHENAPENIIGNPSEKSLRSSMKTGERGSRYMSKTESSANNGRARLNQDSKDEDVQIPMPEFSYHSLLYFHDYWQKDNNCHLQYQEGNMILSGRRENTKKLKDELQALREEMSLDKIQVDLKFKDTLRKFENVREHQEVFMKYFENHSFCRLEFAGFSKEKIKEIKEQVSNAIEKEKELEMRRHAAAEAEPSTNKRDPQNIQRLYTNEGLEIQVYKGNITNLNVDCIVSSNTQKLSNVSGVAKAIADVAGQRFKDECQKYSKENGDLVKGFCCTTGAGNLPYKHVIHVVGPIWERGGHPSVEAVLKQSILSILKEADRLRVRSIAIPAISAGQKNANKSVCTRVYAEAVCLYSAGNSQLRQPRLKEVHFVDRDDAMVELIVKGFQEHLQKTFIVDLPKAGHQSSFSSRAASSVMEVFKPRYQKRKLKDEQIEECVLTEFIKVIIWKGDILKSPFDYAICCGQDSDFKSDSKIAKTFKSEKDVQTQISQIKRGPKLGVGDVFVVNSKNKVIYYVVIKSFTEKTKKIDKYLSDIAHCVEMVLTKAEASKERAIAVPLLGTGNKGAPKDSATGAWLDGVLAFLRKSYNQQEHHLREIYFVTNQEPDIVFISSLMKHRIENCSCVHDFVFDSLV